MLPRYFNHASFASLRRQLNYFNFVSWLFNHGAAEDISKSDINGITPMYIACQNNNIEICQFIYDHGGSKDINRPDSSGFTG